MPTFKSLINAALLAGGLLACAAGVQAQATFSGHLCCNMRTDGSWISDINYADSSMRVIPAGTPVEITGYGRYRVHTLMDGQKQDLGNDYSRDLDMEAFARRYVVSTDVRPAIAAAPANVRRAIEAQRLVKGMTRQEVLAAVGWPVSSENPDMDSKLWRFWLGSFEEFQVKFDGQDRLESVSGDAMTLNRVMLDPS